MSNTLGLIAGGGVLPLSILAKCKAQGRSVHVVTFKGQPHPSIEDLDGCMHHQTGFAQAGKVMKLFKSSGCTDVVMAGFMTKPSLFDLKPDIKGIAILKNALSMHDNALFKAICTAFEDEGFTVKGAHEVCPELLAKKGVWGKKVPNETQKESIRIGMKGARAIGYLDIGQAAIVKDGLVLGLEGVEGTAQLIERCASLRGKSNKGGFLVKAAKPDQEERVDLPSIGPDTIKALAHHHYEGVAVLADHALVLEEDKVKALADAHKLIVCGVDEEGSL